MDIQVYISSGIIERYALGLTSPEETEDLEALALAHPEIRTEVEAVQLSLENYALRHAITPPVQVKDKLMKQIRGEAIAPHLSGRIVPLNGNPEKSRSSPGIIRYAAAACLLLLVGSLALNFIFYGNWKSSEKELASVNAEKVYTAEQLKIQQAGFKQSMQDLALLKNPDIVKMEMKGQSPAPNAKALVYCDTKTNEIYLDVKQLPPAPDSMQYQFWAIVGGKPVDAGMIELCQEPDTCFIHKMNTIPDAHIFAISLEKKGGNPAPKGQIYATFGI